MRISRKQPLAIWRKLAGYSQDAFAKEIKVNRASVSAWENGTKMPRANNIAKIEEVLNIDYFNDVVVPKQ